ncbi:CIC11C00000000177 [Sungouiella intermedia]|uniref:CIC11C00000000177 n=1 Tax=Sungouiella intermedia TaxID=45354 RepID=A0A1L0D5D8_9ASCO|nr:CIC11C00000000177 [[Candida] intermedia]
MTVKSSSLFSGKVSDHLPMVVGGKGNYLVVEDALTHKRREVFDAMGGAAVCALGHGDEEIIAEMAAAAKECSYSFCASMTNYYAEELANFYIEKSPKGVFAGALFTCSGSESNENGMKVARQYYLEKGEPERTIFISRKQSYHGYTIGCLALSETIRKDAFRPITLSDEHVPKVSPCYPYRDQKADETVEEYCARLLQEIEDTVIAAGPNKVCAILCETLSGSTFGTSPAIPGYLLGVRAICDKYGILMWLDEVMCGTGRASATGGLNCWESFPDFKGPDMQSIGKTLGSGYVTIAGLLVSPKVKKAFVEGTNYIPGAQTYHQHAFNCRVALAVQKKIDRLDLRKNAFEKGEMLGKLLKELAATTEIIGDVRGMGSFWSVELVKDKETKETFPTSLGLGAKLSAKCLENGMTSMGMGGTVEGKRGDHLTVAPTFILKDEDVQFIAETLVKSVKEVEADLKAAGEL